jgi:flagellar motor component MotA
MAPIAEKRAFEMVQAIMESLEDEASDKGTLLNVDHKFKPEQLMVKLLFYASRARHGDVKVLEPYLRHVNSSYFTEGLTMLLDGFDTGFIENRLEILGENTLFEIHLKMDMALEMCLGIKAKLTYDEIFTIAKAYL